MESVLERFSRKLRLKREALGISQEKLANMIGLSVGQIRRYEAGAQMPRVEALESLGAALEVSPFYFYEGEDEGGGVAAEPVGMRLFHLRCGRSIKSLAPLAGIDEAQWLAVESGEEPLTPLLAERMASAMGASIMEVMGDQAGPMTSASLGEFHLVPFYGVDVSAGHGAINDHEPQLGTLAFRRDWIHNRGLSANKLMAVRVDGDSMAPELNHGDTVLVDRSQSVVLADGLYVLRLGHALYVKRVQRLPGNRLRVTSLNTAFDPFDIDPRDPPDDVQILGRVVWVGRDL